MPNKGKVQGVASAMITTLDPETGEKTETKSTNANTVGSSNRLSTNGTDQLLTGYTQDLPDYDGSGGFLSTLANNASSMSNTDGSASTSGLANTSIYNEGPSMFESNEGDMSSSIEQILTSGTIQGVFGMPYQFLSSVDRRISGPSGETTTVIEETMGRKYSEKIASHLPLLFLTPCRPKFMEGFKQSDQESIIGDLLNGNSNNSNLSKTGRYYTTEFAYAEYYKCVNLMCSEVAFFAGIQDEEVLINGKKKAIGDINWMTDLHNDSFNDYFAAKESVVLYIDGLTTISDSFSNNVTDSQLASTLNGFSDTARELKFILGNNSALSQIQEFASKTAGKIGEELGNVLNAGTLAGGMLTDLASTGVSTIMTGGKLLFPKIWGDSTFSRSYSFELKLRSPDHDSVSIFMNILVPYIHLLALCMPQSITEGDAAGSPNAYNTPFLVRAYAKGLFNINMGMITDLSVTRGGEAQWNDNGLPTQIDIAITVEDLYSTLFMTNPSGDAEGLIGGIMAELPLTQTGNLFDIRGNFKKFFNLDVVANTEMLDFLANLAGLNIAAEEIGRKGRMIQYLTGVGIRRTGANLYNYFETGVSNIIRKLADIL